MSTRLRPAERVLCAATRNDVALPDRLALARAAGFTAISIWTTDAGIAGPGVLAEQVRAAGLRITEAECVAYWLPEHVGLDSPLAPSIAALTADHLIALAEAVGAPSISVAELCGVAFDGPAIARHFGDLCDRAADHGLRAALEFLPAGGIANLAQAWEVIDRAGRQNGGLVVDSLHFFRSASSLDQLAGIPGDRIFSIQLNDAPAVPDEDMEAETMNRLLPGEGALDLFGLLDALEATGTTAPVGIEVFSRALDALPAADAIAACGRALDRMLSRP